MLKIRDLSVHYGKIKAVRQIDMDIAQGEIVSLIGANGAGKSTTLRALSGLVKAAGGSVEFEGKDITGWSAKAIVEAGIPVMAHIGLTPQTASQLGGFKVQGKDESAARRMLEEAQAMEMAGAFSIVLEAIPAPLAKLITAKINIPTIGIGAGVDCDGQVLVLHDMIGLFDRFVPKFVKKYTNVSEDILAALNTYAKEVETGEFPGPENSFTMKEDVLERLKK